MLDKLTYNWYYFIFVWIIIQPINLLLICDGKFWVGFILAAIQCWWTVGFYQKWQDGEIKSITGD